MKDDAERLVPSWRRCIKPEGDDERETSSVHPEEECASLNALLRMCEGSSSSSLTSYNDTVTECRQVLSHIQALFFVLNIRITTSGMTPTSIFIRIALAKLEVIGLGGGAGDTFPILVVPSRTTQGTGVYALDDDFDEAGYTNPLPTADE